jgi:hypothetical protein
VNQEINIGDVVTTKFNTVGVVIGLATIIGQYYIVQYFGRSIWSALLTMEEMRAHIEQGTWTRIR